MPSKYHFSFPVFSELHFWQEKRILFVDSTPDQQGESPDERHKETQERRDELSINSVQKFTQLRQQARNTVQKTLETPLGTHSLGRVLSGHIFSPTVPQHIIAEVRKRALAIQGEKMRKRDGIGNAVFGTLGIQTTHVERVKRGNELALQELLPLRDELVTNLKEHGKDVHIDEETGEVEFTQREEQELPREKLSRLLGEPWWAIHTKAMKGVHGAERFLDEKFLRDGSTTNLERSIRLVQKSIFKLKGKIEKANQIPENNKALQNISEMETYLSQTLDISDQEIKEVTEYVSKYKRLPNSLLQRLKDKNMLAYAPYVLRSYKQNLFGTVGFRTLKKLLATPLGIQTNDQIREGNQKTEKAKKEQKQVQEQWKGNDVAKAEILQKLRKRELTIGSGIRFRIKSTLSAENKNRLEKETGFSSLDGNLSNIIDTNGRFLVIEGNPSFRIDFEKNNLEIKAKEGNTVEKTFPLSLFDISYPKETDFQKDEIAKRGEKYAKEFSRSISGMQMDTTKKIQFSFQTDENTKQEVTAFFGEDFSERYEMQISKREGDTLYLRQRKGDRYEIILFHLDTGILQKQNSMINVGRLSRAPELVPTEDPLENGNPNS